MSFSIVHALMGLPQDAPLPEREPEPAPIEAPAPPKLDPNAWWYVTGVYHPQDHGSSPGGDHIAVTRALDVGRLHRAPGDPLCRPAAKFWGLTGWERGREPTCKRCLAMAARLGLDLTDPTKPPTRT